MSRNPAHEGLANCRFYVEIDKKTQAVFTEVSGIQVDTTVQEYEEGGNNGIVHKLPGRSKVGNVTLKRGMTQGNEFFKWYAEVAAGRIQKKGVSLIVFSPKEGDVIAEWEFLDAFPVKWVGPQFVADGTAIAVETVEFAHAGLRLVK